MEGYINKSLDSSCLGTELNRRVTAIKKKNGATTFHILRHTAIPMIHPTNRKYDYIQTEDVPPPMALFPLRSIKEIKSEANLPVKDDKNEDAESYRISDDEVKLEDI